MITVMKEGRECELGGICLKISGSEDDSRGWKLDPIRLNPTQTPINPLNLTPPAVTRWFPGKGTPEAPLYALHLLNTLPVLKNPQIDLSLHFFINSSS